MLAHASLMRIYTALLLALASWSCLGTDVGVTGLNEALAGQGVEELKQELYTPSLLDEQVERGEESELGALLIEAVKKNELHRVKSLIKEGADLEAEDEHGGFPLGWASYLGYADIAQELLDAGAMVNHKDNFGLTGLMVAANHDQQAIVILLLDAGASVNAKNIFGDTALSYAKRNMDLDIAKILKEAGAEPALDPMDKTLQDAMRN